MILPLLTIAAGLLSAQSGPEERVFARFAALPEEEQRRISEAIWAHALAADHPLCRAATALRSSPRIAQAAVLAPDPARAFDADEMAPALQLRTQVWQPDSPAWKGLHRSHFGRRSPPPLPAHRWAWDPGRNALLRPAAPPTPTEELREAWNGRWPADGRVEAWALGALDDLDAQDPVADYFEHAYRNRGGGIYAGIRLWDVWDCGREFEVSDVEAIAWLRTIGGDRTTVSPIPDTRHREIYRRIKDSFLAWREPWTLRRALAVRMLQPWQAPDPQFGGAVEPMDAAWILCAHDPGRMSSMLARDPSRNAFLAAARAELDRLRAQPSPPTEWTEGWAARESLSAVLRASAEAVLREEGLLGFGAR